MVVEYRHRHGRRDARNDGRNRACTMLDTGAAPKERHASTWRVDLRGRRSSCVCRPFHRGKVDTELERAVSKIRRNTSLRAPPTPAETRTQHHSFSLTSPSCARAGDKTERSEEHSQCARSPLPSRAAPAERLPKDPHTLRPTARHRRCRAQYSGEISIIRRTSFMI